MQAPDPTNLGLHGELVPGPPWIFGLRGTPREAPENTLASLRAALALGLDGIAYDVRACASGDFVLCADARLERTSDATGELRERTPAELARVDAGVWFSRACDCERLSFSE
jgi:glycerophosphoryl diester phosphodiesterase